VSHAAITFFVGFAIAGAAIVLLSFLVEAMRPQPVTPERLPWAPDIAIRYVTVNGARLRYIMTGDGPTLVLLHKPRQREWVDASLPDA
jgi:hypothetical protein